MTRLTTTTDPGKQPDLPVVILAWNARENIELLLPALTEMIADLGLTAESVVADGESLDGTAETPQRRLPLWSCRRSQATAERRYA
jgi:hypothetical protein